VSRTGCSSSSLFNTRCVRLLHEVIPFHARLFLSFSHNLDHLFVLPPTLICRGESSGACSRPSRSVPTSTRDDTPPPHMTGGCAAGPRQVDPDTSVEAAADKLCCQGLGVRGDVDIVTRGVAAVGNGVVEIEPVADLVCGNEVILWTSHSFPDGTTKTTTTTTKATTLTNDGVTFAETGEAGVVEDADIPSVQYLAGSRLASGNEVKPFQLG